MRRQSRLCQRTYNSREASFIGVRPAWSPRIEEDHQHQQEAEAEASAWIGAPTPSEEAKGLLAILPKYPRKTTPRDL